ncbi:hypothetical protein, partial [Bifidobacterium cuniculi]
MAGEGFLAGKVIIDVEPNTRGFARKLREALEKIDDATVDLNFNVDDAMAQSAFRKWDGRNGHMDFAIRVDDRQLRNLQTAGQKLRDDWAKKPVEISADTKKARDAADAWWDKFASTEKSITDRHAKELKNREAAEAKSLKDRQANLQKFYKKNMKDFFNGKGLKTFERLDLDNLYGESIGGGEKIHTQIKKLKDSLQELYKVQNLIRVANDPQNLPTVRANAAKQLESYSKQLRDLDYVQKSIVDNEAALGKALESSREIYKSDPDRMAKVVRGFSQADSAIAKMVGRSEESTEAWQEMTRAMGKVDTKTVVRDLGKATASVKKFAMAEDNAADIATKFKREMAEQSKRISKAREDYKHYGDSIVKAHKYGLDGLEKHKKAMADMDKVISTHEKTLTNLRKKYAQLGKDKYKIAVELETKRFDAEMTRVGRAMASLDERVTVEIRARVYDDAADDLQRQLEVLKRQHVTVPVDVEVDVQTTVAKMRQAAESIRKGDEIDFDVDIDIDDMNARRKLRDLQNDYDEMKMDVDVETALARAHLASFTRPRTVDIFARFRGTDMGKILGGMTYGATGLKGVENSFQNLVNLFDTLDRKVPKLALVSTVLSDIGAGAINLAGTVGGLGKSIVSLSKAAYAAPVALIGLGAAYANLRMIMGEEGAAWKENVSLAGTAMENMASQVQKAFYGKAAPAIKDLGVQIGDVLAPAMVSLAEKEGVVVEGVMRMVTESGKVGQVARVFTHVNDSVDALTPGINGLVRSVLDLADAGGQYLPQFANWISRNVTWFATWASEVQKDTATVDTAMAKVKEQAGYLGESFFALKDIIKGVFEPLSQNQNGLERFAVNLQKANEAVHSVSFQETMQAWVRGAQDAQHGMRDAFSDVGQAANKMRDDVANVMKNLGELTGNVVSDMSSMLSKISPSISKFSEGVRDGFSSITKALDSASPMIRNLVEMAGQLTKTFGSTFSSTLKAVAPTIESIAKVTEQVAKAFDSLPDAVKGAAGIWMTFGRAGKSALDSLKLGMLENVQKTIEYQGMLQKLGMSADTAGISFGSLVRAQLQLKNGNIKGVLSDNASGLQSTAQNAAGAATQLAAVGTSAGQSKGILSLLGGVMKSALPTVAFGLALGDLATVFSSYQQHVAKAKDTQESFNEVLRSTPGALTEAPTTLEEVGKGLNNFGVAAQKALDESRDFWDNIDPTKADFSSISEALDTIGESSTNMAKALSGSRQDVADYDKVLNDLAQSNIELQMSTDGEVSKEYKERADAARTASEELAKLVNSMENELKVKARSVGKTDAWVDSLRDQGQSIESVAESLLTATERTERLSAVTSKMSSVLDKDRSAFTKKTAAEKSYYEFLDKQLNPAMDTLRENAKNSADVWNKQEKSFNMTTEAGRYASDMLIGLADNQNAYVDAMIASGAEADTVVAKHGEMADQLRQVALEAGVADDQADALVQTLLGTPEEVRTKVSVETLQAKTDLVNLVNMMQFLFPDESRDQVRELTMKLVMSGDITPEDLSRMMAEVSEGTHEFTIYTKADGTQTVVTQLNDMDQLLSTFDGKVYEAYLKARAEGKSDVDALLLAFKDVPEVKDVIVKAQAEGKDPIQAIKDLVDSIPEAKDTRMRFQRYGYSDLEAYVKALEELPSQKKTKVEADTEGAKEKVSAFVTEPAGPKDIAINADTSSADGQLVTYAAVNGPAKKVPVEAVEDPVKGVAAVVAGIMALIIPPKKVMVEGNADQAWNVMNAVAAFGSKTIATPWARVQGEKTNAQNAINAISKYGASTIARPWARVQGENTNARNAIKAIMGFSGRTIARPWARVQGDSSDADSVISAIARTDGTTVATRYVKIVTTKDGEAHVATGGRIHGPGSGTSDSIPAMLSNGEHVIRAAAVRKLDKTVGPNFLHALNATGSAEYALAHAGAAYLNSAS